MIKLHMMFECDLPTTVEAKLKQEFQGESGVREEYRTTGKQLVKECPAVLHWMVANGYMDCDLILTVGATKENAQVEEPVAQQPVL